MDQETANYDTLVERLVRRGSEQLLSDSSLRDALDDEQAQQLLDWGLDQVRASAEQVCHLPPEDAQARIDEKVHALRRRMQRANRLLDQIPHPFDRQVVFSHLLERITRDEEE